MASLFRSIGSYFGFLTSAPPVASTATNAAGEEVTTVTVAPTAYVTPDILEEYTLIGTVTLVVTSATSDQFFDFPLSGIAFNPPVSSFSVSKIQSVTIRAPAMPHDADWSCGIWGTLPAIGRTHTAVANRAPNEFWVWRSNVVVQQAVAHDIPWPAGRMIADSLHAVLPAMHPASLQFGLDNQPNGTASGIPAGNYTFTVLVKVHVAGRGLFGTI